jgi:ribosomal protein L44E
MVLVANKQKKNYNNNDLRAHCHHCKTKKTKQELNRMLNILKHYIALVSQKNIKQKQNT